MRNCSRGLRSLSAGTVLALTALAAAPAVAAPGRAPDMYRGAAEGTALLLEVHLPAPVEIPGVGTVTDITQSVSLAEGSAGKPFEGAVVAEAMARLGDGSIKPLNDVLGAATKASLRGDREASDRVLAQDAGLVQVGVGERSARVTPEATGSVLTSTSTSSLARLTVGLGGLPDNEVTAQLKAAAEQLNAAVEPAVGSVTIAITEALDQLGQVSDQAPEPVQQQVEAAQETLTGLLAALQQSLAGLADDVSLVDLTLLRSSSEITRKGALMTATATTGIGGIDVLGGLIHIEAVKTVTTAAAGGVRGSAAAKTTTQVVGAKVGDLVDLKVTPKGVSGAVLDQELPPGAAAAVAAALAEVNKLLDAAGVRIIQGDERQTAAADGKSASASSEGVVIVIDPLKAGDKPLLALRLVPANVAVEAGIAPVVKPAVQKRPVLAQTGGDPSEAIALLAAALLVGLVAIRRRSAKVSGSG